MYPSAREGVYGGQGERVRCVKEWTNFLGTTILAIGNLEISQDIMRVV